MPRTRSLAWSQLKIGIIAVAGIILAIMLILAVGGQGGFAWERYALKTKFSNIKGLKTGAVVRIAGVDVGKVTAIDFVESDVQVTLNAISVFVGEDAEDHVAGQLGAFARCAQEGRHHHRHPALHVERAASPDVTVD